MFIKQIHIKGFRNFEDETIVFQKKTLIIGANDVGKTNLLYALRLLFDKTISEHDLELSDSDYNAYSSALEDVNKKLTELSIHHEDQTLRFVAGESDADKLLENLSLAYLTDDNPLSIGGDGRKNQIFLATWMAKQNLDKNIGHVTFYAIEEPESHLHPHQQRKLSNYIQNSFALLSSINRERCSSKWKLKHPQKNNRLL